MYKEESSGQWSCRSRDARSCFYVISFINWILPIVFLSFRNNIRLFLLFMYLLPSLDHKLFRAEIFFH